MSHNLDSEIQEAWDSLAQSTRRRTYFFTTDGHLKHGAGVYEVGTFTSAIGLCDFRAECYFVYEQLRRARHG